MSALHPYLPPQPNSTDLWVDNLRGTESERQVVAEKFRTLAEFQPRILINHPPRLDDTAELVAEGFAQRGVYPLIIRDEMALFTDPDLKYSGGVDYLLRQRYDMVLDLYGQGSITEGMQNKVTRVGMEQNERFPISSTAFLFPAVLNINDAERVEKDHSYWSELPTPFGLDSATSLKNLLTRMVYKLENFQPGGKWVNVFRDNKWMLEQPYLTMDFATSVRYADPKVQALYNSIFVVNNPKSSNSAEHSVHIPEKFVDLKISEGKIFACCAGCGSPKAIIPVPRNNQQVNNGVVILSGEPCAQQCGKSLGVTYNQNRKLKEVLDTL